ncbi:MAG: hypothetical protein RSE04_05990 [Hydrogenoanaerobacterium sp.]
MKVEIIKDGVTDQSSVLDVGTIIDLADVNAASLIKAEYAIAVEQETDDLTVEEMTKKLDEAYKADTLKEAAIAVGVSFEPNATKATVVAAVIEAGKYVDLMQ